VRRRNESGDRGRKTGEKEATTEPGTVAACSPSTSPQPRLAFLCNTKVALPPSLPPRFRLPLTILSITFPKVDEPWSPIGRPLWFA
jgi:hypothetical protein